MEPQVGDKKTNFNSSLLCDADKLDFLVKPIDGGFLNIDNKISVRTIYNSKELFPIKKKKKKMNESAPFCK